MRMFLIGSKYSNILFPVGGTALGRFRRYGLAERSTSLGVDLSLAILPICKTLVSLEDMSIQLSVLAAFTMLPHHDGLLSSGTISQINNSSCYKLPWSLCFITATEK